MSANLPTAESPAPAQDGEAEIGERITILDLTTTVVRDCRLVAAGTAGEPRAERELAADSPLGSALLGRHVGDVIVVEDDGRVMRLEVVEIDG